MMRLQEAAVLLLDGSGFVARSDMTTNSYHLTHTRVDTMQTLDLQTRSHSTLGRQSVLRLDLVSQSDFVNDRLTFETKNLVLPEQMLFESTCPRARFAACHFIPRAY